MAMLDTKRFSPAAIVVGGVIAALALGSSALNRFETADDIPSSCFTKKETISGKVVKIIDGDTFRLRHIPNFFYGEDFEGAISKHSILVRLAAIDTPETAKFGNTGQEMAKEAKEFTKSKLLNKRVNVKLLSKDQYGRVLGQVSYSDGLSSEDIAEELLRKGFAIVYRQKGAQYGDGGLQKWNIIEVEAKRKRLGIWGLDNVELPAEYKKRIKANAAASMPEL